MTADTLRFIPRVRGTLVVGGLRRRYGGFIPGEVRGTRETAAVAPELTDTGPSPRVRGTPHNSPIFRRESRFIPRPCGEHPIAVAAGSSSVHLPRVREHRWHTTSNAGRRIGFIPARAGEHYRASVIDPAAFGSSPRGAGNTMEKLMRNQAAKAG